MSLSLLSLFVCVCMCVRLLVCLQTLTRELCSYAYSLPPAPIHPHTFMYAHNWMKLSTFGILIPSKDWGHLLAIDTAGDAIWGHHTPPCAISIQTGQQSSPSVHTNDRGQGKQRDNILQCPAPAPGISGGGRSYVSRDCSTYCYTTEAVTAQTHWDGSSCWYVWDVFFFKEVIVSLDLCAPNHTPVWWKGRRKAGGCSCRLMVHAEREHRPTVAVPWFICHLVLMKLQTAVTHTCCHGIFLYQGLCWFVDSCVLFSCECMHAHKCGFVCVLLLILSDDNFSDIYCIPAYIWLPTGQL